MQDDNQKTTFGSKVGGGIGKAAGTALFGPVGGQVGEIFGKGLGLALDQKQKKIEGCSSVECKLCGSNETIKSFRSHLRWKHPEYNSEKYIQEFGEFRPKIIKKRN